MKIAIFGAGAVGGYIGARLAQAGNDVAFIARGAHLEAIREGGLAVKSISGDFNVFSARATDRPQDVGVVDVVLCGVKSWQVRDAARGMAPMVGPQTRVIPIQNGVEAHVALSGEINPAQVLPGLCKMIGMVEGPGRLHHAGIDPVLAFGRLEGGLDRRVERVAREMDDVQGLTVQFSDNILADLWRKFMIIAPWSGVGALTRMPIGVFRSVAGSRELLRTSIREVHAVAVANGVDVKDHEVAATIDFLDQVPPQGTASMQRDIMAGRPSELNEQNGAVVRLGRKRGLDTPVNRFIYHSLLPMELKARGELST